jgi:Domain of unknown function (DUF3560)
MAANEEAQEILEKRADRYDGKKEARIERYYELAQKHEAQSTAAYNQSKQMASCIPMGQPIMVGHHSEGRDRRFRDKIWDKMGQSVKHAETAEYYENKAESVASNTAIQSDDPEAITKLKERIAALESNQQSMKAANKIILSKKLSLEEKAEVLTQTGHSADELLNPKWGGQGYEGYQLSNNSANIRRLKQRLAGLEKSLKAAAQVGDTEENHPDYGLVVVYARSINRLQLKFNGKPSQEIRTLLKSNGFRWAPSEGSWQRFLTNSRFALDRVIEGLAKISKPTAGKSDDG